MIIYLIMMPYTQCIAKRRREDVARASLTQSTIGNCNMLDHAGCIAFINHKNIVGGGHDNASQTIYRKNAELFSILDS